MVQPTAHATREEDAKMATQHAHKAEDAVNQAGQHAASAASTVGHDIRQAGHQAAEAARYIGDRLTAPIAGEDAEDTKQQAKDKADIVKRAADEKANNAAEGTKSTYEKIKSSLGSFMADSKRESAGASEDAAHKAANKINRGLDKAQDKQQEAHDNSASKEQVKEQGQQALDTAKETAVQTKDAVVGGLSYVKGRLTAPVSGEEEKDEDLKEKAQEKTSTAADRVADTAEHAGGKASSAARKTKAESKSLFSSIKEAFQPKDKEARAGMMDEDTHSTLGEAKDTVKSAGDKVKDTMESAKAQMREAAEAVEPKTPAEAVQAEGGIPSNTAELLKEQQISDTARMSEHQDTEAEKLGATSFLNKTAEGWAGENLTGEGDLGSVRAAVDEAGPHSRLN